MHVIILSTILTAMFHLVIVNLTRDALKREITDTIKNLKLYNISPSSLGYIIPNEFVKKLENRTNLPDKTVQALNFSVTQLAISWIIMLVICFALIAILTKISLKQLAYITLENIVTFAFVGVIEVMFFYFVAFKYIPAPPSTMAKTFKQSFANGLVERTS